MSTEDIVRRFARRRDFELVDFATVALPMYAITIECICAVHRAFPPIALYVLRAIKTGLGDEAQISAFLGLDPGIVRIALDELTYDRYVTDFEGEGRYTLSEVGQKIVLEEERYIPQEETHTFIFDGILRRPISISGERLLRPSEIDRSAMIEIRPYPGALPGLEELKLGDVVGVLKSQHGEEEFDRDVLALSRITRRSKVFRTSTGLAYKMKKGPEIQIAFLVDGVPYKELEQVFAEKGGARKMGFMKALSESGIERAIRRHLGNDIVNRLPDEEGIRGREEMLTEARRGLEIAVRRADNEPNPQNKSGVDEAKDKFEQAVRAMQEFQVRPLAVYEAIDLLNDALTSASSRVYVAVSEAWHVALDRELFRLFDKALKSGVEIWIICFRRRAEKPTPAGRNDRLLELERLADRYKNLKITQSGRQAFFFLVKDAQFAAIANRPLLGPASRSRMFHQFAGYLLQAPELVDAYVSRLSETFGKAKAPQDSRQVRSVNESRG